MGTVKASRGRVHPSPQPSRPSAPVWAFPADSLRRGAHRESAGVDTAGVGQCGGVGGIRHGVGEDHAVCGAVGRSGTMGQVMMDRLPRTGEKPVWVGGWAAGAFSWIPVLTTLLASRGQQIRALVGFGLTGLRRAEDYLLPPPRQIRTSGEFSYSVKGN